MVIEPCSQDYFYIAFNNRVCVTPCLGRRFDYYQVVFARHCMCDESWLEVQSDHTEQNACETTSLCSAEHIDLILWNPKIHYYFHDTPAIFHVLSQLNAVYFDQSSSFKVQFNILSSAARSSKWFLSFTLFP